MIELTEQQIRALAIPQEGRPRLLNPLTNETFVLVRAEEYDRLQEANYDDSPWTREELQALAWETATRAGWDDLDEADQPAEQP